MALFHALTAIIHLLKSTTTILFLIRILSHYLSGGEQGRPGDCSQVQLRVQITRQVRGEGEKSVVLGLGHQDQTKAQLLNSKTYALLKWRQSTRASA